MNYANYDDVVSQLRSAGLLLDTVKNGKGGSLVGEVYVESTRSVRCDVSGERKKQTGAYWLHELRLDDGVWLTGAYWIDHGNASYKIELRKLCSKCGADMPLHATECKCGSKKTKARQIPAEQLAAHKARMEEAKKQAEADALADAERAAAWADAVWLASREIESPADHDYLSRKKLAAAYGARLFESNEGVTLEGADRNDYDYLARFHGALVVPMLDKAGRRRGLQFILSREKHKDWIASRDGRDKEYWPRGMLKSGLHYVIGGEMHGIGLVAEGFATAASLREATNLPVAVAFDANNLGPVGEIKWKQAKKRTRMLYCADDDWLQRCKECKKYTPAADPACRHCGKSHGKENAGVARARDAALATSGAWLAPVFAKPRPDDRKGPTDFNDLRCLEGEQAVGAQVKEKLAALEWSAPSAGLRVATSQKGGGDGGREPAMSIMPLDDLVHRYVPVDDGNGEHLWDTRTCKIVKQKQMVAQMPAGVRLDNIKQHPVWIERGAYYLDQIGFDPAGEDKSILCNMWRGWPTEPKKGKCDLLLELLRYQCGDEASLAEDVYRWVLCWLAYPIQHPGTKMQTAIIMHGPQGTGKGRFFEWGYMPIFGRYGVYLDQDALEDKHGSDWQSCRLFVLADEVLARAEMYHHKNKLKNLVTSRRIRINPKGLVAYEEANHLNIVFLSNEKQPLVLENDDRRYCVIWTPPPVGQEFYDELSEEIENGGVEALHHYLKHEVDLGDFKPWTRPPMTEAKRDLINLGRDSVDRFLIDWKNGDVDFPFCPCASSDLYRAYLAWCKENGERMPRAENQFSGHIVKMQGWFKGHKDINMEDEYGVLRPKRQRVVIPSEAALNESAKSGGGDFRHEPGKTTTEWLTMCFFTFRRSLQGEA